MNNIPGTNEGMSFGQYLMAQVVASLCANPNVVKSLASCDPQEIVECANDIVDRAMHDCAGWQ